MHGLTGTSASGSCQVLFVPGVSFFLAGLHLQNEETSIGSGEELGLAAIQAEGAIQGEVAVIHSLRGVFLDRLRD